ncbi:beta-ketoacyl-[acyl-carrier-protein] synthase family protein [Streptomyces celluloflavus]|uniref:beta-ketoacyl-[acyl-carrier-protein] synthase family protein n=1 Tax=Streptomyces celluloflavus TaxID=58344 RepID=UPI0036B0DA82
MTPRVVVTGLGVVCSTALGSADFSAALRAGRSGAGPIDLFDTRGFAHAQGCQVPEFEASRWLRRLPEAELGRAGRFAAVAARMAATDARLAGDTLADRRCLVSVGTTDGGSYELDQVVADEIGSGPSGIRAELVRKVPAGALSTAVARELGLSRAETMTMATACAAGNHSVGDALDALRQGSADLAFCGGADALCRRNFTGFYRLGLIAPDLCRPFDIHRQGLLTGEGAGVLVLETEEAARARGARRYAEVLGCGINCDAHDQMTPEPESIARCMRLALDDAGVKAHEVDLISAHGTGTEVNDMIEGRAIREVFGPRPPRTVALKSMLGHTMGAASALAGIACVLSISEGFVPPTINHTRTDPACGLDRIVSRTETSGIDIAQNNGLAFGGNNAVVLYGRC